MKRVYIIDKRGKVFYIYRSRKRLVARTQQITPLMIELKKIDPNIIFYGARKTRK